MTIGQGPWKAEAEQTIAMQPLQANGPSCWTRNMGCVYVTYLDAVLR
jgi:hypothetical protein